jgi:serine/arginine repetitive matrix protein 2
MYNGIGILTPRGTGTSGYVQTNKFNLRGRPQKRPEDLRTAHDQTANRKPDEGILDHNRRREIELKVVQMADLMEEQG